MKEYDISTFSFFFLLQQVNHTTSPSTEVPRLTYLVRLMIMEV